MRPGESDNFVCDLNAVMKPPITSVHGTAIDVDLLEVRLQVSINYQTGFGPFVMSREFVAPTFCGIRQSAGYKWFTGETTTPDNPYSKERNVESFYAGNLNRCFTQEEVRRLLGGVAMEFENKNPKPGTHTIRMLRVGPFVPKHPNQSPQGTRDKPARP